MLYNAMEKLRENDVLESDGRADFVRADREAFSAGITLSPVINIARWESLTDLEELSKQKGQ